MSEDDPKSKVDPEFYKVFGDEIYRQLMDLWKKVLEDDEDDET